MPGPLLPGQFAWPLLTIDFEASALGKLSFPIEIAMCRWRGPDSGEAETWHSLIGEDEGWRRNGVWNASSQAIHGIERRFLKDAPAAYEVMAAANRFAGVGAVAWCDGGGHDSYWLTRLADAAGMPPSFLLGPFSHIGPFLDEEQRARAVSKAPVAHRAAPDAESHVRTFARALGVPEPSFRRSGP